MNNQDLLAKIKKIRNSLEIARKELNNAKDILNDSITFNNTGFKNGDISNLNSRLNTQIYNINNKIIPKINNM